MKPKTHSQIIELTIRTFDGDFVARYSENGLAGLDFPGRAPSARRETANTPQRIDEWHRKTSAALVDALAGKPHDQLPPLDLSSGSAFQQRVWAALREIPCGQTRSYAEVAQRIGHPKALRAVGSACGANPIPVLIPCHRVLAAHNRLGGFSAGLKWKRRLLAREAAGSELSPRLFNA